jgi:hypothetical protein
VWEITLAQIVTLVVGIAWPLVIGAALYLYRVPISALIASISNRSFKVGTQGLELSIPPQQAIADTPATQHQGLPPSILPAPRMETPSTPGITKHFAVPFHDYISKMEQAIDNSLPVLMQQFNITREDALKYAATDSWAALGLERASRYIYGSQIDAINMLNARGGRLPLDNLRPIYGTAVITFPFVYENYSFEQWLLFLTHWDLIRIEGADAIIAPAGKVIVSYLQGLGYLNTRLLG